MRHMPVDEARRYRKENSPAVFLAGLAAGGPGPGADRQLCRCRSSPRPISSTSSSRCGRLRPEAAEVGDEAAPAFRLPRLAHIAPMQDQPVMRMAACSGREPPSAASLSTSTGVLPGARPVRLPSRKRCVSTAMVGCAEGGVQNHIGGLAADTRQRLQRGAVVRHLAAMPVDQLPATARSRSSPCCGRDRWS